MKDDMTDIVERLRLSVTKGHEPTDDDALKAADEIERLREALEQALDDMRDEGLSVCQATKELMQQALTGRKGD
jgi:hypothetical protein